MDTIIQFFKDKGISTSGVEQIDVSTGEVEKVNQLFKKNIETRQTSFHLRIRPKIEQNQLWSVKSEYVDFLGNTQKTTHPFLVSIVTNIDKMEDEEFVRVFVVSPFVEMATKNDEICKDTSIIGFPFLVETWNEQPVLTEILNSYLGHYDVSNSFTEQENLNAVQKEFREVEISRAKYLNHSIMAMLTCLETNHGQEFSAVISFFGKNQYLSYPKEIQPTNTFIVHEPQTEHLAAAKSGLSKKDKSIQYQDEELPFDIQIRKNDDGFTITVSPVSDIEIFDSNNEKCNRLSNKDKIVFSSLKKGLYTLNSKQIKETIKIRLK
ncbi:hypothetical protein EZS27_009215 [termite gut metagenome]|uniref:Uncharacterized protein n=1 Tax=termite gut metagenome TaxID=433724 RepID=A0A5J4SAD8_9ZZZZ